MKTIREAANELCDRWDTPLWKDAEHTSVFVHELRMALANHCEDDLNMDHIGDAAELVQPEPVAWLSRYISGELDFDEPNNPASVGWSAAFPVYDIKAAA